MIAVAITVFAYLVGSIPFGYLIVRAKAGSDIRESGSGGTGATNVSRRAGKWAGVLTLLLDAAKGAAAALTARGLVAPEGKVNWFIACAAIAVVVGHIFPVWLGFRGGKGVATAVGVFLVLAPFAVTLAGVIFLIVVLLTRYVSLASMTAAVAVPVLIWGRSTWEPTPPGVGILLFTSIILAALILFAHRSNMQRLLRGTENRFR